jgi:NTE family protein
MLRAAVSAPRKFRPLSAALALLADGRHDILAQLAALGEFEHASWPVDPLWICAVRRHDGRRAIFGRTGTPAAPLHLAVGASCAVPGYFAPVRIGRHSYVDGGAHSPTNAALLRETNVDLAVIISPMSGRAGLRPSLMAASRRHASGLLRREVAALRAAGIATVVFEPGPAEQVVMGNDFLSRARITEVIQQSFFGGGAVAARTPTRDLLRAAARSAERAGAPTAR